MLIRTQNGIFITLAQNNVFFFPFFEKTSYNDLHEHENRVLLQACHTQVFKKC